MKLPTKADLQNTFEEVSKSSYKGMKGVMHVQGASRRKFLLTVMTHGNEPSGLAAIHHLGNDPEMRKNLKGDLLIAINNMAAGAKYFEAKTQKEKRKYRRYEMNMNRLPEDILDRTSSSEPYEIRRAHELYPLYRTADVGLDIHSFFAKGDPMIIDIKGDTADLDEMSDGIPLETRVMNIVPIQQGYPVGSLYGGLKNPIPVLEVETGRHQDASSNQVSIESFVATLMKTGFLEGDSEEAQSVQKIYRVTGTVRFPDTSYRLLRRHQSFGAIQEGEVIAKGNGKPIVAALDCHTIFGVKNRKLTAADLKDERMFLAAPMRERMRKLLKPVLDRGN
jgi:predicted deacylase